MTDGSAAVSKAGATTIDRAEIARLLDADYLRSSVRPTLLAATRNERPFPYVVVHPLLPERVYELLAAAWPAPPTPRDGQFPKKLDVQPVTSDPVFGACSPEVHEVWTRVVTVLNRQVIGPWLKAVFAPEIEAQLALLRQHQHVATTIVRDLDFTMENCQPNAGRLMFRGYGYKLEPHIDPFHFLVTVLLYFPQPQDDESFGTRLFEPERPIPLAEVLADGSKYYDRNGIKSVERERVPFRPNTLLAFPNTPHAAHGVVTPGSGYRRVYQFHLSANRDEDSL